jgi:hypothetical protein
MYTSWWRKLETQSFLNTILLGLEQVATDNAAHSAVLHTAIKILYV